MFALVSGNPNDNATVNIKIGGLNYQVVPVKTADNVPALVIANNNKEFWVLTGNGGPVLPDSLLKPLGKGLPVALTQLMNEAIFDLSDNQLVKSILDESFNSADDGSILLSAQTPGGPGPYGELRLCDFQHQSSIGLFLKEFFDADNDISDVRGLIEEAYSECPISYGSTAWWCDDGCVDPVCVVEYIDNLPPIRVSDDRKAITKARLLETITGLEDLDLLGLPSKRADLNLLYQAFTDFSLDCVQGACGLQSALRLGVRAVLDNGTSLNAGTLTNLIDVLEEMACDDLTRFNCMQSRITYGMEPLLAEYLQLASAEQTLMIEIFCPELLSPDSELHVFPINGDVDPLPSNHLTPGLTITSTYAAPLLNCGGNSGASLIAQTPGRGNVEDLTFGTDGNGTGIRYSQESTGSLTNPSTLTLTSYMRTLFSRASSGPIGSPGPLQSTADHFVDFFRDNGDVSTIFARQEINEVFANTPEFIELVNLIVQRLALELQNGINSSNVYFELAPEATPDFSVNSYNVRYGLTILFNNTEQSFIYLENFQGDPQGIWTATLCVETIDHFGVDRCDVTGDCLAFPANVAARARQYLPGTKGGFAAWWVLQHQRNLRPFLTRLSAKADIEYENQP